MDAIPQPVLAVAFTLAVAPFIRYLKRRADVVEALRRQPKPEGVWTGYDLKHRTEAHR